MENSWCFDLGKAGNGQASVAGMDGQGWGGLVGELARHQSMGGVAGGQGLKDLL